MGRFTETEVLVHVAEQGSITKAAEVMGQSVSAVSRYLAALEERLGVRLVNRTTRRFSMTEAGEIFYSSAKDILTDLQNAEAQVGQSLNAATGTLRVTASTSFSLLHLMPIIPRFTKANPEVTVELTAHNRYQDIIENGVDLAIRTRRVEEDSSITIRKLAETRRRLVASPAYVAEMGMPTHPDDLQDHRFLIYTLADDPFRFNFAKEDTLAVIKPRPYMTSNEGQLLLNGAIDGMGIIAQPSYIVEEALQNGSLVRVLDDWDLPRLTINLAFPSRRLMPAKTRNFIEFLVSHFRDQDFESRWID